jgi:sugar phosphate permease
MNKILVYQLFIFSTLYVGYGFYYFTRKSVTYMLPFMTDSLNITKNDIGIYLRNYSHG